MENQSAKTPKPLKGIKVIDFTHAWSGPTCTTLLGDMGADVIKIEPITGDFYRATMDGAMFPNVNRNKRSISLNLKEPEGFEIAWKMLQNADVYVENFVPGVIERLGFGYDKISEANPGIILGSISGYGQFGPYSTRPGFDPVAQAVSGIMLATGEADRPPVRILPSMIDYSAGLHAAFGIICALMEKQRTGKGQRIDISLIDMGVVCMSPFVTHYGLTGQLPQRFGSGHQAWVPYQAFETNDGYILIAVPADHMWKNLCKEIGLDDIGADSRFATPEGRRQHRDEIVAAVNEATRKFSGIELEERLCAVGVPSGKLRTVKEVVEGPYMVARGLLQEIDDPELGPIKVVNTPIFFSDKPPKTITRPPLIGEHTLQILHEQGYTNDEIKSLSDKGVIRSAKVSV